MKTPLLTLYLDRLQNGRLRVSNKPVRPTEPSKHPISEALIAVLAFALILYSMTQTVMLP